MRSRLSHSYFLRSGAANREANEARLILGNGGEKQHLEDKAAKINTVDLWENRLPDLRTVAKASDVARKGRRDESEERLYNPYESVPTAWKVRYVSSQLLFSHPIHQFQRIAYSKPS